LLSTYARYPVEFVRGSGTRLWDSDHNEYLDFLSGISVTSVGHCHPDVVEAIKRQAERLLHVGNLYYTAPMAELADRLAQSSLGGGVFFTNSGAEANEAALKLARKAKPGGDIVVCHGAFHGRTLGALSVTPQESKQAPFGPLMPGCKVVVPTAEAINAAVDDNTAAVLLEVVQGESGIHPLPLGALYAARDACERVGAALILDEVQTGMGRTGSLWAYQQAGIVPDAITVAKALGGGLPIGALVTGRRLADVFVPGDHGSTFAGGPVQAAAALAVLNIVEQPEQLDHVRRAGERLRTQLATIPGVTAVRGRGLMIAFDLAHEAAPDFVRRALFEQRLVVNAIGDRTVRLLPALVASTADLDEGVRRLRAAIAH
jgi:predicted acetylornithine/succinylornithine family transaminase